MVVVAVKVTLVPEQIVSSGTTLMLTLAGRTGLTVIVMLLDVAGEPEIQVAFDVITHVMMLLFARVDEVYVEFVAPEIFVPFFFHW